MLSATRRDSDDFSLVALVAEGEDIDAQLTQCKHTLYGITDIIVPNESGDAIAKPCFYFTFSEYFRYEPLDAAVLVGPGIAHLCPNDRSVRAGDFRSSPLYELFAWRGALTDPRGEEEAGSAFIADCDLDRRDEEQLLSFVKRKYQLGVAFASEPTKVRIGVIP